MLRDDNNKRGNGRFSISLMHLDGWYMTFMRLDGAGGHVFSNSSLEEFSDIRDGYSLSFLKESEYDTSQGGENAPLLL